MTFRSMTFQEKVMREIEFFNGKTRGKLLMCLPEFIRMIIQKRLVLFNQEKIRCEREFLKATATSRAALKRRLEIYYAKKGERLNPSEMNDAPPTIRPSSIIWTDRPRREINLSD